MILMGVGVLVVVGAYVIAWLVDDYRWFIGGVIVGVVCFVIGMFGVIGLPGATKESDVGIETTISESEAVTDVYTIADIIKSEDNYIVISNDEKVIIIPQNKVTMNISEKEMVIAEKNGETVTKATFLITKERMLSLIEEMD